MKPVAILFGAGLVVVTSYCLGALLLRSLATRFQRIEQRLFAFILGSACLSAILFVLCTAHVVRKGVLLGIGLISMGAYWRWRPLTDPDQSAMAELPPLWRWTFLAGFALFSLFYFVNALAPEISPDGTAYHLAIVDHYNRAHGFEKVPTSIYFNISQGGELLFLMAFAFGKHSAAAMVHFAFLATLPWLILAYGQRYGFPIAGVAAGLLVYASPVVGVDGASAYIDVALAVVLFALFYLLQVWEVQRDDRLLVAVAILAGFSFALKYTAVVGAVYAIGFVLWKRRDRSAAEPFRMKFAPLVMAVIIAGFTVPWLVKSWMWVGNPIAPFGNALFPNPWVHVSFEKEYQRIMRRYDLTDMRELPWQATVKGDKVAGLVGPIFLLIPLALFAVRRKPGRQLLLAGLIMALPYTTNIGMRFLIPALPFFSLVLAIVLAEWPWVLYATAVAHLVLSLPPLTGFYCGSSAWRLDPVMPARAAFRLEPEDAFLRRKWSGYVQDRLIEEKVPKGEPVFMSSATSESYTTRRMLVGFLSAPNEALRDILWTPLVAGFQPTVLLKFHFPQQTVQKLRIVKTGAQGDEMWSIAEFEVLLNGREIPRSSGWRLSAKPNPWDVQMAFDNSPVTRWKTWQPAAAGDYVEIDFGHPQAIDAALIASSSEYTNKLVRLEALDQRDEWRPVGGEMHELPASVDQNLRKAATEEFKARGIHYLFVYDGDLGSADFRTYAVQWGLKKVGEAEECAIYRIE